MISGVVCGCLSANSDSNWEFKDYLPIISSSVVIILFIIDRFIAKKIRAKEVERNFYYKVLLEPNIEKIFSFFDEVEELYVSSATKLKSLDNDLVSLYINQFRFEIELFKDKKRKFEFQLIFPIQQRYPAGGEVLLTSLNTIQDYYIIELDYMHFDTASIISFNKGLHKLKADFLSSLYKPLS